MQAEPNCSRHAIDPIRYSAKLALRPLTCYQKKVRPAKIHKTHIRIPKATHNCQPMTKVPRIAAGVFSAAKTGIVEAFVPIPTPSKILQAKS